VSEGLGDGGQGCLHELGRLLGVLEFHRVGVGTSSMTSPRTVSRRILSAGTAPWGASYACKIWILRLRQDADEADGQGATPDLEAVQELRVVGAFSPVGRIHHLGRELDRAIKSNDGT
jgi:hypothetical protein